MDLHLGPMQHQATIACELAREAARTRPRRSPVPRLDTEKTDDDCSWVMLKPNGDIEPLEGESMLLKTPDYVSLELRVPQGLRTSHPDFSLKCDDGVAYVTNKRVSSLHSVIYQRSIQPGLLTATDNLPCRQAHGDISVLLRIHTRYVRSPT